MRHTRVVQTKSWHCFKQGSFLARFSESVAATLITVATEKHCAVSAYPIDTPTCRRYRIAHRQVACKVHQCYFRSENDQESVIDPEPMSVAARRQRERQERRASILDAAHAVFSTKGFDQSKMGDIATRAELSKGTLYLYFKSKDDLFVALSTRTVESLATRFERLVTESSDGLTAIRGMLGTYAETILTDPQMFRIMIGRFASGCLIDPDTPSFGPHREQVLRLIETFVTAIERGKNDGSMRPDIDPRQTSHQLWGGLLGTMLIRINGSELMRRFPHPVDFEKFVDGYIQLVCFGLRPDASADREEAP